MCNICWHLFILVDVKCIPANSNFNLGTGVLKITNPNAHTCDFYLYSSRLTRFSIIWMRIHLISSKPRIQGSLAILRKQFFRPPAAKRGVIFPLPEKSLCRRSQRVRFLTVNRREGIFFDGKRHDVGEILKRLLRWKFDVKMHCIVDPTLVLVTFTGPGSGPRMRGCRKNQG